MNILDKDLLNCDDYIWCEHCPYTIDKKYYYNCIIVQINIILQDLYVG